MEERVIEIVVDAQYSTDAEKDLAVTTLKQLLCESAIQVVGTSEGPPPKRSKSAEALTAGAVTVTLLTTAIPPLVSVLKEWIGLREKRRIELKLPDGTSLKVSGPLTAADTQRLVTMLTSALKDSGREI